MRVIAVANQKGGCGKTTTAVNLSACLGVQSHRVLLVDLDPQSHATIAVSTEEVAEGPGAAEVLAGRLAVPEAARPVAPGVDLLPSSWRLAEIELGVDRAAPDHHPLLPALRTVQSLYEFAVLDCPPNTGPLTRAALTASDLLLLPVETSYFALYGVGRMLRLIEEEERRRARPLTYRVLLTLFDRRTALAREVLGQLQGHFNSRLLNSVIAVNVSLRQAAGHGRPITEFSRRCRGYRDYMDLCAEVLATVSQADRQIRPVAQAALGG